MLGARFMPDLVLYDGVCGLCNGFTRFVLRRDKRDRFVFAALQGSLAIELLRRHGRAAADLDTVYVVTGRGSEGERLLERARAVIFVLAGLGGVWGVARIFGVLPARLLDAIYDFVAARRYRWFGRSETCLLPLPRYRAKFIDGTDAPPGAGRDRSVG